MSAVARMLLVSCLAVAGPAAVATGAAVTWEAARVGVPAGVTGPIAMIGELAEAPMRDALAVPGGRRGLPAVVVLHGCAGISGEEETLLYMLTLHGFAVFMPDSFARPGRRSQCDVGTTTAVVDPTVYSQRAAEIDYARDRLRSVAWIDQDRVFLLGVSEGGAAAATHATADYAGVVIIGWHCGGRGVNSGLRLPGEVPVLALIMEDDPWYERFRGRHCGEQFGARPASRSLILPGTGHAVLRGSDVDTGERVKRELLRFFRQVTSPARAAAGGG